MKHATSFVALIALLLTGCTGGGSGSSGSAKRKAPPPSAPNVVVKRAPPKYKANDKDLIGLANQIQVYSTPAQAEKVLGNPTRVEENAGDRTVYYSLNNGSNEVLRLKYREGKLIGKQIIHSNETPLDK